LKENLLSVQFPWNYLKQHADSTDHNIYPRDAQILKRGVNNYHKRLFLESWQSALDSIAVNERKPLPLAYLPLIKKKLNLTTASAEL